MHKDIKEVQKLYCYKHLLQWLWVHLTSLVHGSSCPCQCTICLLNLMTLPDLFCPLLVLMILDAEISTAPSEIFGHAILCVSHVLLKTWAGPSSNFLKLSSNFNFLKSTLNYMKVTMSKISKIKNFRTTKNLLI